MIISFSIMAYQGHLEDLVHGHRAKVSQQPSHEEPITTCVHIYIYRERER